MKTDTEVVHSISVDMLQRKLRNGEPVTVLDIRDTGDRQEWSIPGSVHVDAYELLKACDPWALSRVELPVGRPVVTVCNAGVTSQVATKQLRARGIDAWSLEGGMKAWSLAWNTAEIRLPGTITTVLQVRRTGKGCLSYIAAHGGEAAVIDATLDPGIYEDLARERGWTITQVLDTHIHADHLSTSRELAKRNGAVLRLPDQQRAAFPFTPLRDGDRVPLGDTSIQAIATPGHTLESMSYLLDDRALFSGDTLFHAAVGRPDLEADEQEARRRARKLYASLQKLVQLPPDTIVLPGHTDRPVPFDEMPIAKPLGDVVLRVAALRLSESEFVAYLLARIPPAPANHALIVSLNEAGEAPDGDRTVLEAGTNRCAIG